MDFGEILYWHNVVGDNTYYIDTKMGGRTSLFLTSQRMPSRYRCEHEHLQLYKGKNYIYVNVIIYIYTDTPVVVCCHNNERCFLVRYFIYTELLVIIHFPQTQKWAGGHRCSFRHNVCRPATDAYICLYNCINGIIIYM